METNVPVNKPAPADRKKYQALYRAQHKDKLSQKRKTKVTCDVCKTDVSASSMSAHRKSRKHITRAKSYDNDAVWEEKILKVLRKLIDF